MRVLLVKGFEPTPISEGIGLLQVTVRTFFV